MLNLLRELDQILEVVGPLGPNPVFTGIFLKSWVSVLKSNSDQEHRSAYSSRGASRTLAVLRELNRRNGATITELQKVVRISRPSIYRIVDELLAQGLITAGRVPRTYKLTSSVLALSEGFTDDHLVAEIASPILDRLQRKVVWPTELATFADCRMHLQDTTRHQSPMVIDGEVVGRSIPILTTALGLSYLAHCDHGARERVLSELRVQKREPVVNIRRARQLLDSVRARGYAAREGGVIEGFRYQTSTIAVSISLHGKPRAALGITFFSSALSISEAAARYLGDLRKAGEAIEKKL